MQRLTFALVCLATAVALSGCAVRASTGPGASEPPPPPPDRVVEAPPNDPPPPPSRPGWDSTGWVLLGERTVEGREDRDTIPVGRKGQYSAITIVASDGEFEMGDVVVTFDTGRSFSPKTKHRFREGDRTRSIDLPGEARGIKDVALVYSGKGSRARVQVWGREGAAPLKPTRGPSFDTRGWTQIGEEAVESIEDRDTFSVGNRKFSTITIACTQGEFDLADIVITYDNGRTFSPNADKKHYREGEKTQDIAIPNGPRAIKEISLISNQIGGKDARVQVWAK
jgi:hypothetical protein